MKAARRLVRRPPRGSRELVVEGPQAVREAVAHLRRLFVTDDAAQRHHDLVSAARDSGTDVLACSDQVLAAITDTVTPQGLLGVATLPVASLTGVVASARLLVVLWQVRDPGNLGTVIRTADAAGADGVVLAGDCVDPRNPKAVRSSAGSLFHLPVVEVADFTEIRAACAAHGLELVATDAAGEETHTDVDLRRRCALVFGNEARGLDPAIAGACDRVVRVPMAAADRPGWSGRAESLNLAATVAVVVFEAARQRAAAGGTRPGQEAR